MAGAAPPGVQQTKTFCINDADITATTDPLFRFTANQGLSPLSLRITPMDEFDFTTTDETYVLSMEDDGTKISTDNTAIAAGNKTAAMEATFASGTHVASGSVLEIVVTLGGTTPIIPTYSVVEFDYLVG